MNRLEIRYVKEDKPSYTVRSSEDSYKNLIEQFNPDTIDYSEEVVVLYLDRANQPIGVFKHSSGGISGCIIDTKVVLAVGLTCGASSFILAHNHPSGRLVPSKADDMITEKLKLGGKAVEMNMLDHLIVTKSGYYSYADFGKLL